MLNIENLINSNIINKCEDNFKCNKTIIIDKENFSNTIELAEDALYCEIKNENYLIMII